MWYADPCYDFQLWSLCDEPIDIHISQDCILCTLLVFCHLEPYVVTVKTKQGFSGSGQLVYCKSVYAWKCLEYKTSSPYSI